MDNERQSSGMNVPAPSSNRTSSNQNTPSSKIGDITQNILSTSDNHNTHSNPNTDTQSSPTGNNNNDNNNSSSNQLSASSEKA